MADKGSQSLRHSAVIQDKISSVASDFKRAASNTLNFGQQVPKPSNPLSYKVTHSTGIIVRADQDRKSERVGTVKCGDICTVVDLVGRYAKIISPIEGWVATTTKAGVQICRPCKLQRSGVTQAAFANDFERKFAEAKAKQDRANEEAASRSRYQLSSTKQDSPYDSPRSPREIRRSGRSASPSSSDDEDSRKAGRRGEVERNPERSGTQSKAHDKTVPKLSAPGASGGPVVLAPPPGRSATCGAQISEAPLATDSLVGGDGVAAARTTDSTTSSAGTVGLFGESFDLLGVGFATNPIASTSQSSVAFDAFGATNSDWDPFQLAGPGTHSGTTHRADSNPMDQLMGGMQVSQQTSSSLGQFSGIPQQSLGHSALNIGTGKAAGGYVEPMQQSGGYGLPNGSMQYASPYPNVGSASQNGAATKACVGGQVEGDLFNRAMIGVSDLGFEQRRTAGRP